MDNIEKKRIGLQHEYWLVDSKNDSQEFASKIDLTQVQRHKEDLFWEYDPYDGTSISFSDEMIDSYDCVKFFRSIKCGFHLRKMTDQICLCIGNY